MPDSEELEKKEKREFMRETIVKPPLTRKTDCEAGGSLCMRVSPYLEESRRFRLRGKAVCGSVFSGKMGYRRHPQLRVFQGRSGLCFAVGRQMRI